MHVYICHFFSFQDYYNHIKSGNSENVPPKLKIDLLSIFSTLPEIFAFHKQYMSMISKF